MIRPLFIAFVAVIVGASMFISSTAEAKRICGVMYRSYGFLNADNQDSNVYYDINWLGVGAAVLLAGTVIVPVYVAGFSLMRPVGVRRAANCTAMRVYR